MNDLTLIPYSTEPLAYERELWSTGIQNIAGVDEVGRGALAGPVVAAAVIFPKHARAIHGIKDSKLLSAAQRNALVPEIQAQALCVAVGQVEAPEIDRLNILQATRTAMQSALAGLTPSPEMALVDGNQRLSITMEQRLIIKGDLRVYSIAAASIVAKVFRDQLMEDLAQTYPVFGFQKHKGYGTQIHRQAILKHGPSPLHRRSFLKRLGSAA